MDTDNFIKLHDAQIKEAEVSSQLASQVADVAIKLAVADQAVLKQRLENLAKSLDIRWDAQAHESLRRAGIQAKQHARKLKDEEEITRERAGQLPRLLTGGSRDGVMRAWLAFSMFDQRHGGLAEIIPAPAEAFVPEQWQHPETGKPTTRAESMGAYNLLRWARTKTLFPMEGTEAHTWLWSKIVVLVDAAGKQVAEIEARLVKAEAEVKALQETDWKRLDTQ